MDSIVLEGNVGPNLVLQSATLTVPGMLQIIWRPLAELVPYARNARKHTPTQIAKIKTSLLEFGWANPMLVAEGGMIAGHARLRSASELRDEGKVIPFAPDPALGPTIDLSHLSPEQRRAYILADNRLAEEALWDHDLLRIEFQDLSLGNDKLDIGVTGFSPAEITAITQGWSPDFSKHQAVEASLDPLMMILRLRCQRTDHDAVMEAVRTALAKFERATIEDL